MYYLIEEYLSKKLNLTNLTLYRKIYEIKKPKQIKIKMINQNQEKRKALNLILDLKEELNNNNN